jgi:glycosyltransferase involved in cell wall biosynthesis
MKLGRCGQSPGSDISGIAMAAVTPVLAVVVPVYKHSVLLEEAVISALNQEADFALVIVIVNDGCPMPETHQTCLDFAMAAPDRLTYIRRPNGGLSAARNTGIDHVLATWETVKAIYFLDADNRLLPNALQRAYDALIGNPGVGWIYPDIDMFGQEWNSDYSGAYSVLRHLEENICEAGSLVRRTVFESGVRFDESMKLGFEDWDFWLSAIRSGFRGRHLPNFGFRYRRRPESMLSDSERDRPEILSYIKRKHKNLFRFDNLLRLEHEDAPRYGVHIIDSDTIMCTSDPTVDGQSMSIEEFCERYYLARMAPSGYARPPFIVLIDPSFREVLARLRLLQWAFWLLESAIESAGFAYLTGQMMPDADRIEVVEIGDGEEGDAHLCADLVMIRTELLDECLDDPGDSWIMSLATAFPQPQISAFRLLLPQTGCYEGGRANSALLELFQCMRKFRSTIWHGQSWNWRESHTSPKGELFRVSRKLLNASPVYPRVTQDRHTKRIGFVVPLAEFGGVEKVAYNLARITRKNGWSPHLFVFCRQAAQSTSVLIETFDSVNFLCDRGVANWDPELRYMGSHYPSWVIKGRHSRAFGLLCGLDAVANFHCAEAHALMAPLRRRGTKTIASLHVTDLTQLDRPNGHTYLTLGYEHAYDLFACCSQQLMDWCHAMGIPEEKLSLLWNAPSYALPAATVEEVLAAREMREPGPLRVLFLGRLDRQKGLDRLAAIVRSCREADLSIEWRLIGASVIGDAAQPELEELSIKIEPPKLTAEGLTGCYAWADVVLIVSRWEGLPLTVLEAMRLGVVVCATAVGAVAEAISDAETGFLLPSSGTRMIVRQTAGILRRLCRDRSTLQRVSRAAAAAAWDWTWENSARDFLQRLDRLTAG